MELKLGGKIFQSFVLIAHSLTSDATLGLDFLEANHCILKMADHELTFPEHGVTVSLCESSPDHELIQARKTLDKTCTIPPFSMLETTVRVNGKVWGQMWLLQECKTKQLPVKVANGLVKSACDQVPVRLLNPCPDNQVVYKGTKIPTVEEIEGKPHGAVLAVQSENKGASPWKRRVLGKMVEECAGNLTVDQKEQLSQLLLEYADIFADEAELGRTD